MIDLKWVLAPDLRPPLHPLPMPLLLLTILLLLPLPGPMPPLRLLLLALDDDDDDEDEDTNTPDGSQLLPPVDVDFRSIKEGRRRKAGAGGSG